MERFLIAVVGAVAVILALILASNYRARPPASDNQQRTKAATVAVVAFAGILVLASLAYAGFATLQWRTAEAQRRELEVQRRTLDAQLRDMAAREHRAWVYATPALDGPMIIKGHGVSLATQYKVANTGDAPAVDTQIASAVLPHVELDLPALQKSLCEGLRTEQGATPLMRDSLLPHQSLDVTRIEGVGADLVDGQIARQGGSSLKFWWVGCVGYQSFGNPARHRSGFIYEIAETAAGSHGVIPISVADQIIPKDRLVIIPYPRGGFSAD